MIFPPSPVGFTTNPKSGTTDPDHEFALVLANNEEDECIALFASQRFVEEISGIVWSEFHNKTVADGAFQILRGSPILNLLPAGDRQTTHFLKEFVSQTVVESFKPFVDLHDFRAIALSVIDQAQTVPRLGVVRFQANGLLVGWNRFAVLQQGVVGNAEIAPRVGIARLQANGFLQFWNRFVVLLRLGVDNAETIPGVGIVRLQANGFLQFWNRF